jgi:hypothetical protein
MDIVERMERYEKVPAHVDASLEERWNALMDTEPKRPPRLTYGYVAAVHGRRPAFQLLRTLEKLAEIKDDIASIDLEARFERAVKVLCEINFALPRC